jgi:hypothetical protein
MPIVVYTGPTRTPDQLQSLQAMPEEDATAPKKKGKAKAAVAKSTDAKSTDDKPAPAKPAAKPAATKPTAKKPASGKDSQAEPSGAKAASAGPWTPLSSSALAGSPPPDLHTSTSSDAK